MRSQPAIRLAGENIIGAPSTRSSGNNNPKIGTSLELGYVTGKTALRFLTSNESKTGARCRFLVIVANELSTYMTPSFMVGSKCRNTFNSVIFTFLTLNTNKEKATYSLLLVKHL